MYPIAFRWGELNVPSYFLVLSLTCCLAMIWAARRADRAGMPRNIAIDLCLLTFFFGLLGARGFHVIFEYPVLYMEQPQRILHIWEGGFVFYGGALSAFGACLTYLKLKKHPVLEWLDLAAPVAGLSYAVGRIGCFLAGCCYGKACQLAWAVTFPPGSEGPVGIPVHPTQLYATFLESLTVVLLLWLQRRKSHLIGKPGDLFWIWLMLHGLGRIVLETFRADYRGQPYWGLSLSTWISLILMSIAAYLYLRSEPTRPVTV